MRENGVFGSKAGRDRKNSVDLGEGCCECGMMDLEWAMRHENISPTDLRSTQMPFGLLVNNTDHAAGAADRRRSFRRWRGIYNVEC